MRGPFRLMGSIGVALLVVAATATMAVPATSSAATISNVNVAIVPIPGFPGTGNILGAGAALNIEGTLDGTEATGGVPSQVRRFSIYFPAGTKIDPTGFPTCSAPALEAEGPTACPRGSQIAHGTAGVVDPIGGEDVHETAQLDAFAAPKGEVLVYANAASPISAQIEFMAHFETAPAPYGPKLVAEVPLIDSVPGAPAVSTTSIKITAGAAIRADGKTHYYGRVPATCPTGGFPGKGEFTLESGESVTTTVTVPCPTRSAVKPVRRPTGNKGHRKSPRKSKSRSKAGKKS